MSKSKLQTDLLRSVSRSFYLSLRLLPRGVREPISLAYLLARATDTIADTSEATVDVRLRMLPLLANAIAGDDGGLELDDLRHSFAVMQHQLAERELIELLPECLTWLDEIEADEREDIRAVLGTIVRGQMLDLQRFGDGAEVRALATGAELDHYTYLVAGCVGEFWTRVCARKIAGFSARAPEEMLQLGTAYGKGLQLTNILRDVGGDFRGGRCYLPADELHSLGVEPAELVGHADKVQPILDQWRARSEEGVRAGIDYACAIGPWRVRLATALPALIGARTLALLRTAGADVWQHRVKVTRAEVRGVLVKMLLSGAAPASIRRAFAQLSS